MSFTAHRHRALLIVIALGGIIVVVAAQLVTPGTGTSRPRAQRAALAQAPPATAPTVVRPPSPATSPTTTTTIASTTTTALPPTTLPPPTTTTTTPPAPTPVAAAPSATPTTAAAPAAAAEVPAIGHATTWGCAAALAYLQAYAAKGFALECPGDAEGHDAMTCLAVDGACPASAVIAIADPCPAAYMNEASNSWVLLGASDAPIDPYGPCPS